MRLLFLLENTDGFKFVKCPWHYLQLVIMEGFLPITLSICLFMDTQAVDLLEGEDWSNVRWTLFPSLSLSE